jgi:hypothetical protein
VDTTYIEEPYPMEAPLIGGRAPRRAVAFTVAAVAALAATVLIALAVVAQGTGVFSLMQKGVVTYYMPSSTKRANQLAAKAAKAAAKPPVVYYYMPKTSMAQTAHQKHRIHMLAGNDTAATEPAFVCTVDNLKTLSAEVQTSWDACEAKAGYRQPNADAKRRRLLEWVWEPEESTKHTAALRMTPKVKYAQHRLVVANTGAMLAGNDTAAAAGGNASAPAPEPEDEFTPCKVRPHPAKICITAAAGLVPCLTCAESPFPSLSLRRKRRRKMLARKLHSVRTPCVNRTTRNLRSRLIPDLIQPRTISIT